MSERHPAERQQQASTTVRRMLASLLAVLAVTAMLALVPVQSALAQQGQGGGPQSANIFDQPSAPPPERSQTPKEQNPWAP